MTKGWYGSDCGARKTRNQPKLCSAPGPSSYCLFRASVKVLPGQKKCFLCSAILLGFGLQGSGVQGFFPSYLARTKPALQGNSEVQGFRARRLETWRFMMSYEGSFKGPFKGIYRDSRRV